MTTKLSNSECTIINQLLDTGVFTSSVTRQTSKSKIDVINSLKKGSTQQRINKYLDDLLGMKPENFQENLLLLLSSSSETAENIHVILATLKTIINLPDLQNNQDDRVVETAAVVRQVHSEVVELDEKVIYRLIVKLFVDRFQLFTPDLPEYEDMEHDQEVTEFWDVDPNFNFFAQGMVNYLKNSATSNKLTIIQQVNRALLIHRYLSPKNSPRLWMELLKNKEEIAQQWSQLGRFDLECGNNYALLLDKTRQPSKSKQAAVAIAVAQEIHEGIPENELMAEIKKVTKKVLTKSTVSPSLVKQALLEFDLVEIKNDFVSPTAIVKRFAFSNDLLGDNS